MINSESDYKQIFSELIKKQMLILGPQITLSKVKSVPGITVDANGEVTNIQGDSQALLQNLINQFVELSGLIVKKTMESILTSYPNLAGLGVAGAPPVQSPVEVSTFIHQEVTPPTPAPVETPAYQASMQGTVGGPATPITMPSVEEIHKPPIQQPPPPVIAQPETIPHVEPQVPVQQPVQVQTPSVQVAPQTVATQNPAAMDDLSPEEVEKLNKMIQEMNQMDEKKQ